MKTLTTASILSLLFLLSNSLFATIVKSNGTGGGAWDAAETWAPSIPACGDTITIVAGDVVTVETQLDFSGCGSPMFITIDGTLDFNTNGMKLRLPCGSGITINIGGSLISTGGGGGANNKIEICGSEVWRKSNGRIDGYFLFGAALPVKLISFEAVIDNTSVKLMWKTESEINNDYFTIEKSENGINFEELDDIPGSGNSNTIKDYEYYDENPLTGTAYYRLKQTDYDGKFEYVKLIALNYNMEDDGTCILKVYPNPCIGGCNVDLADCPLNENEVNIQLYDAFGNQIVNRIKHKSTGNNISFHLNSSNNLSPGVYIVKSSTNSKNQSKKVIIK